MQPQFALIVPLGGGDGSPGYPSNALPGAPGHPSQGLPWGPGHPSQGLPGAPGHPSQGLPPGSAGAPSHPIVLPPGESYPPNVSHPIVPPDAPPGSIWPPLPPNSVWPPLTPGEPTRALVIVYISGVGSRFAVVELTPDAEPK
jgi:hypothetical protein